ncbi:DUF192 domain-containing protein [Synechococcus sp. PCC 6717]|jgi:uncharacterized membrane protein (UPF0127 family)|uniref:DUF192 domain-containing protein n=1 Tax=Parathermosynechococcus lividus PCC 6715 TaxID=1917166 RepID=A0A2D2Q0Y8_PARLV|nr:DUF192 domain-containing protein [Thermostichus lividus]ATS18129.1 hypothetical protein BRW62_04510 [Thermostichus lividus PCC 6715]MCI3279531.1 DUF192 domain-containing protein [Synechococcus sp. PCC 6717]
MFYGKGNIRFLGVLLISISLLLGCQALSQGDRPPGISRGVPQYLPITAKVNIHDTWIELEVARTPAQQQLGLMFRSQLAANRGMLFPVSPPQVASFWMKNCLIALDLIFIRSGQVVAIVADAPPCQTQECPTYESGVPVDYVLELAAGRADELGLRVGDPLTIQYLDAPQSMLPK